MVEQSKETKAQKIERLKREKDPWERLDEIREFARQGHGSIPAEWLSTYFRFWGIYTQGDGAGAIGGKGGEGMAVPFFMVRIRIPNGFLSSDQARTIAALAARSPTAKIIDIGKRCGRKLLTQGEINSLLIFCAATAEVVVRLKGGDPCILGRAGEEIEALADAGIAFEIVPGITSAIAGAAAAGISLTDRRFASSVVFATAHRGDGADAVEWDKLVSSNSTLAVYMPGSDYPRLSRQLREAGVELRTPCMVISAVGRPDQQMLWTDIGRLAGRESFAVASPRRRGPLRGPPRLVCNQCERKA